MNEKLVLEPKTAAKLLAFASNPTHALIIFGAQGAGKLSVAQNLITEILGLKCGSELEKYPYFKVVSPEKSTISIESIRELQKFFQLKTLGVGKLRRAVIVEDAHSLTTEAQNAFLKLLEEPPADTIIILTCSDKQKLLPTILSRAQSLALAKPDEQTLKLFFGQDSAKVNQMYYLSGGLPGLMSTLLLDADHPLALAAKQAKDLLALTTFDRVCRVEQLSRDKENFKLVLQSLSGIARICIVQAAKTSNDTPIKQWHKILKLSAECANALEKNANTKLVATNLLLGL